MSDTVEIDDPQAGLKRALASVVRHSKLQRDKGRTGKSVAKVSGLKQPKHRKPKKGKPTKARRTEMSAADRKRVDDLVPKEAQQHGIYETVDFKLQEVTEGGKRKEKVTSVIRNRGGTAVERWFSRGRLDDRQMAAIMVYQGAFRVHIGEPRVVANWSAVIVRQAVAALEMHADTRMRAKQTLRLFDQEIFFRRGLADFNVWQNVVIFDEPAGVAGSRLGYNHKPAEAVAQVVVSSVAHEIASLVIDRTPRDLSTLLLDIDAPRRSRSPLKP